MPMAARAPLLLWLAVAPCALAADITSSLVLHLTVAEGAGAVVYDSSGAGHHMTLANGVAWDVDGVNGPYALRFNGQDQYIYRDNTGYTGSVTYAVWVKTTHKQGAWVSESSPTSGCYNLQGHIDRDSGVPVFDFYDNGESTPRKIIKATTNVADGAWHHLAAVISDADNLMLLYVDGVLEASSATAADDASYSRLWFGGVYGDAGAHCLNGNDVMNGLLDEIMVYHRDLSVFDVLALARVPPMSLVQQLMAEVRELRAIIGEQRRDCAEFVTEQRESGTVCKIGLANDTVATSLVLSSKKAGND